MDNGTLNYLLVRLAILLVRLAIFIPLILLYAVIYKYINYGGTEDPRRFDTTFL